MKTKQQRRRQRQVSTQSIKIANHMKSHARESMIHICCFIKINRDICNWRMTNNKTFTSTFLTCRVNMVASCSIHSFGLFVCFVWIIQIKSNEKWLQEWILKLRTFPFSFLLCMFCVCSLSVVAVVVDMKSMLKLFTKKKNGNRMTNYLKPLFTFDSSFRMSYQKRWVSFMSQITHIRMSPF